MQYVDFLGSSRVAASLPLFAKAFFRQINVTDFEERESSNEPEGTYFKGSKGPFNFKISISGEETNKDLPYWIHISADLASPESLLDHVNQLIRKNNIAERFLLARIINYGKRGEVRLNY